MKQQYPRPTVGALTFKRKKENLDGMITCYFEKKKKAYLRHVTVDALLVKKNKILLIKRASHLIEGNKYALPGGFLDRDETTAEGVLREVKEETGYEGKIISLFRINDNPDRKREKRQNVVFVYLVQAKRKVAKFDKEVTKIKWFSLDKLPKPEEIAFDHYENIELYRQYRKEKFSLPIIKL